MLTSSTNDPFLRVSSWRIIDEIPFVNSISVPIKTTSHFVNYVFAVRLFKASSAWRSKYQILSNLWSPWWSVGVLQSILKTKIEQLFYWTGRIALRRFRKWHVLMISDMQSILFSVQLIRKFKLEMHLNTLSCLASHTGTTIVLVWWSFLIMGVLCRI